MSDPDLRIEIEIQDIESWLSTDLPHWSTRTRFHSRPFEREGVIVLTAKDTSGTVGYALFDKPMSHIHHIEIREDCRRRGVASRLWARVREHAAGHDVFASSKARDSRRRLSVGERVEIDGTSICHEARALNT